MVCFMLFLVVCFGLFVRLTWCLLSSGGFVFICILADCVGGFDWLV